ncbi:MAG: STAS domain-containing protein, partial [Marmoricola sp.]
DLAGVTFIDSSGLGALVQIQKSARDKGVSLVLTRSSAPTRRLLELTGLQHVFTIAPSE